jgi:hypothetical protein
MARSRELQVVALKLKKANQTDKSDTYNGITGIDRPAVY